MAGFVYIKTKYQLFADKEFQTTVNNCDDSDNELELVVMIVLVRMMYLLLESYITFKLHDA